MRFKWLKTFPAALFTKTFALVPSLVKAERRKNFPLPGTRAFLSFRERARHSMHTRIALSLAGLSLACFFVLSLCGLVAYNYTISHIVRWHMDPILRMLVATSRAGEEARIHSLATDLRVLWYTGNDIPEEFQPAPGREELSRIGDERYVLASTDTDGQVYAVVVKVRDLDDIEDAMFTAAMACGAASLLASLLLSLWLSRRLVTPVVQLTERVRDNASLEESELCARKDEVGRLARAFASREQSLKAFLVREQLFTGDVSHELRTPLTVLQGCTEILEIRVRDANLTPVLSRMQKTLATMTGTVATLLLLARKPEQLEQHLFDMSALARNEEEFVSDLLKDRLIVYEAHLEDHLMIRGNPDLAALVLHNLLDNACRYTSTGSIVLTMNAQGFNVRDTAPHIDEAVRKRMFERGMRGNDKTPGSGLGLSLVQRGCERMGWQVSHSLWDEGNVFTVLFAN